MATAVKKSLRSHTRPEARLEARVSRDVNLTLKHAAAVSGHKTPKSLLIDALPSNASTAREDHRLARLTTAESHRFVRSLLHPPAPNAARRAACGRYRAAMAAEQTAAG
jgi:uncharacterized protein (DUF1778 family)